MTQSINQSIINRHKDLRVINNNLPVLHDVWHMPVLILWYSCKATYRVRTRLYKHTKQSYPIIR